MGYAKVGEVRGVSVGLAGCRNPWSCRNRKELIQRARHMGHRRGTEYILTYMYHAADMRSGQRRLCDKCGHFDTLLVARLVLPGADPDK